MLKLWWLYKSRNYWRARAEVLELKLESERIANRRYEREMISRFITLTGAAGIVQEKQKQKVEIPPTPPAPSGPVLSTLSPQQLEDWQMYQEDALANGKTVNEAWHDFFQREVVAPMMIADDQYVDVEN